MTWSIVMKMPRATFSLSCEDSVPFSLGFAPIEKFASHKFYLTKFLHYEIFKVQVQRGAERYYINTTG